MVLKRHTVTRPAPPPKSQKIRTINNRKQEIARTVKNPPVGNPQSLPKAIQQALPPSIMEPNEAYVEDLEDEREELESDEEQNNYGCNCG